eukprot:TRINITY_DN36269_c0_g2_i2.p4 TRINITY_DN36269_c0_g2~~TRINITY_DN36269_c0_g2_i2.p4  ORF type:complete len:190 (-),score=29.11 TRINITY_DN36269_c0_g2_i2:639-1208(-)
MKPFFVCTQMLLCTVIIFISLSPKIVQAQSQDCCFTRNCTRLDFMTDQHPYKNSDQTAQPAQKDAGIMFLMHPILQNTNQCFFSMSFNCRNERDLTECLPCCCETRYMPSDSVKELADLSGMVQEEWLEFNGYEGEPESGEYVQVCNSNWRSILDRSYSRNGTAAIAAVSVSAYSSAYSSASSDSDSNP